MKRRAQMQIGEMVMVLIVVFMLGISSLVWYNRSAGKETERVIDEDSRISLAQTARVVSDMPELRYSLASREDAIVIDYFRAQAFAENIDVDGKDIYRERFAGYKVELRCVQPCSDNPKNPNYNFATIPLFDYTIDDGRNQQPFVIPVLIHDPVSRRSSFGTLTVTQVTP
jgi:hypothetical protein